LVYNKCDSIGFYHVAFVASIFFLLGFWLHYPGLVPSNYSDIIDVIWRKTAEGKIIVPYIGYELEYPALSAILVYVSSTWRNLYGYYYTLSLISYGSMLLSIYLVYKILARRNLSIHRITYFIIFTPTFLYFSIYSFDWFSVALLLLSIYYAHNKKASLSGLFMGFSVAARIIPIVCLPFVVREFSSWRKRMLVLIMAALAWLACNIYFILADFEGFLYPYLHQTFIQANESSWLNLFPTSIGKFMSAALLLGVLALILLWGKGRLDLFESSFLALLGFVLVSFKFPPQYMILLLPFFALHRTNYILFTAANLLNVMIILWWFTPSFNFGNPWLVSSPVQWLAMARQIILLPIFISFLRLGSTKSNTEFKVL